MLRPTRVQSRGFTIIEVLIVLAIGGVILTIVLLVVPAVNRSSRNYQRRHLVNFVGAQLNQYEIDNGHLPSTAAEQTAFTSNYISSIPSIFTVEFHSNSDSHGYFPQLDTITVQYEHWCNRYGDGDSPDDAIAGTDSNPHNFVIWTQTEPKINLPASTYCIDNHP